MSRDWVVPPGYRALEDLLQEHGRDHVQTKLASGQWPAFRLDLETGDLKPISATTWCVPRGLRWLEQGGTWIGFSLPGRRIIGYAFIVRLPEQPSQLSKRETPQPRKKRESPQAKRIRDAIGKLFPNGTDGIASKAIHRAVADELKLASKKFGFPIPSETSVRRALGRRK